MLRKKLLYLSLITTSTLIYLITIAYTDEKSFKSQLLEFINKHERKDTVIINTEKLIKNESEGGDDFSSDRPFSYQKGDWEQHIITPYYKFYENPLYFNTITQDDNGANLLSYGSMKLNLSYGDSVFTNKKYQRYPYDDPGP